MKKLYFLLLFSLFFIFSLQKGYGQLISTVTPTANPLECNNLVVTVTGQLLCANASVNSTGSSVVGNTIFIDIDIFQPMICLPAIVPMPTQMINAGMIPAGTYTLSTRTFLNGTPSQTSNQGITIGSCCAADGNFSASAMTICESDSVSFTASTSGQASYNWKVNGTSFATTTNATYTFPTAGSYMIELVATAGGCADSTSQTITVTDFPQLTFPQITAESCPGNMDGGVNLQVSGGTPSYSYSWSNGASTQNIMGLSGGIYQVWVTDNTGCISTDSATVQTGLPVTAGYTYDIGLVVCSGDSVNLTSTSVGATNYDWQVNGQSISQSMMTNYIFGGTGVYNITLLASNTICTDSINFTFEVKAPAITGTITNENCVGAGNGEISLNISGGTAPYTTSWSTGATTNMISSLDDGNYSVWVTDSLGCISADTFSVGTDNITPTITPTVSDETCAGAGNGIIDLMVSGGVAPYTYSWSTGSTSTMINQLDDGNYTVTVTDDLGCISTDIFAVGTSPGFIASFTADTATEVCPGTTVGFSNTSMVGSAYTWLNNDTVFAQTTDADFTFEESGLYTIVLVAEDSVCNDSADLVVTVFDLPTITDSITNPACPGDANGEIDLTLSGGNGPFIYAWSTGSTNEDILDLGAGTYSIEITDNNGCVSQDTFELTPSGGLTAAFSSANQADSSTHFTDLSDTTAVSWSWDFGDGTSGSTDQNPIHSYQFNGSFNVCLTVVDAFGCTDTICEIINISLSIGEGKPQNLRLYPNPTTGKTTIELDAFVGKEASLSLFDINGKQLFTQSEVIRKNIDLDISTLPKGVYIVLVKIDNQYFRSRLMKD